MGEYYAATLTINEWPGKVDTEERGADGTRWTEHVLKVDHLWELADERFDRYADLAKELTQNMPDTIECWAPDTRELTLLWHESSYGIAGIEPILHALKTAELAFQAWDEGKYEIPGEEVRWTPTDPDVEQTRSVLPGGDIALAHSTASAATAGDVWDDERYAALGRWVARYFELDVREPVR